MKIKLLHYVFGPCMKGYDIYEKKPVVRMGQKTIGLSEELLSQPEILSKLEELAFGDALEPNMPFEKLYFTGLPDQRWLIGRGIRGMDSAGRKAYFFHHLVMEEADLIKINANPFAVFKKFSFFEKESDLPEDRLIPPTELEIPAADCEFPPVEGVRKPMMENLLAELFREPDGLPLRAILKRGEESLFLRQLLGLLPFNHRKNTGFSTDFFNSYNIQHYFRLVTVNSTQEIPYEIEKIYNFVDREFPANPPGKNDYIKVISQLSPGEIKTLVESISCLQLDYKETGQLTPCREILRIYCAKDKRCLPALFDITPLESAVVLLGVGHPGAEPDYGAFCDFYRDFADRISPGWFLTLYEPLGQKVSDPLPGEGEASARRAIESFDQTFSKGGWHPRPIRPPAGPPEAQEFLEPQIPLQIFTALFRLLDTLGNENTTFRDKLFRTAANYLKDTGRGELLNLLWAQFPPRFVELLEEFQKSELLNLLLAQFPLRFTELMVELEEETQRLIYLVQLPGLEKEPRRRITEGINRNLLNRAGIQLTDRVFIELPGLLRFLESQDMDTALLKILLEMYHIRETGEGPGGGIGKYSFQDTLYRDLVRVGMKMVKDKNRVKSIRGMSDYLYEPRYRREFIRVQLELTREGWISVDPLELFVYWETRDWVDQESRMSIFRILGDGTWKLSRVEKYRRYLEESGKDRPEYKAVWASIIENAQEGMLGSMVRKIKKIAGRFRS